LTTLGNSELELGLIIIEEGKKDNKWLFFSVKTNPDLLLNIFFFSVFTSLPKYLTFSGV
jgi:hypothetical protein